MGCTRRHFLLSICFLQLLAIIERQVFDFLGFMWAPILANFFHIIFVIFGVFGAYQLTAKYIVTYSVWNVLWIGWNTFLICFYLNIGILDRNSDILNLGTGSVSWFEVNGYGCKPTYPINITSEDPYRPVRPEKVDLCLLEYQNIEIIHSAVQCFLAILGLIGAICIGRIFVEEDDDRLSRGSTTKKTKQRQSLYSIEFSPPVDTIRGHTDDNMMLNYQDDDEHELRGAAQLSPKPMTPRRVKRRSIMTRGTTNRQSTTSRRSNHTNRNSVRNSRRKIHQNPVTKIIEQQNIKPFPNFSSHTDNPPLTVSNLKSLNKDYIQSHTNNNFNQSNNYQYNNNPDPIYYNMNASSSLMQQSWINNSSNNTSTSTQQQQQPQQPQQQQQQHQQGHINPSYQHSTPNLSHSPDPIEELYNNRPPSVRSSYSNFHGARPLSSYNPVQQTENVFVQLSNNQQQQIQSQAIPQVPQRRIITKENDRSMAFLNNGPPAYNLNYHTPPDSETTM